MTTFVNVSGKKIISQNWRFKIKIEILIKEGGKKTLTRRIPNTHEVANFTLDWVSNKVKQTFKYPPCYGHNDEKNMIIIMNTKDDDKQ